MAVLLLLLLAAGGQEQTMSKRLHPRRVVVFVALKQQKWERNEQEIQSFYLAKLRIPFNISIAALPSNSHYSGTFTRSSTPTSSAAASVSS